MIFKALSGAQDTSIFNSMIGLLIKSSSQPFITENALKTVTGQLFELG